MSFFSQKRSWFSFFNRSPRRKSRPPRLTLEALEDRVVPSTFSVAETQFSPVLTARETSGSAATSNLLVMTPNGFASPLDTAAYPPYTPAQIRQAYGFNQIAFNNGTIQGDGSGQTIAIVDAYDDPNIGNDLHQFDLEFGLPDPSLSVVKETVNGQTTGVDPQSGWEMEESLDVEWAHAIAPAANIMLVEAYDPSQLFSGVQWAASQQGVSVVSMSFGESASGESANDSIFTTPQGHAGVTFVAAAGDKGEFSYPASSPNVLAVGGTTLTVDSSGDYLGETVWNEGNGWSSGGGQDPNYPGKQGPDVAYNAGAPVWVCDSFNTSNPWQGVGGTSAGAPQWAALIAIADQGRALEGLGTLDGPQGCFPVGLGENGLGRYVSSGFTRKRRRLCPRHCL
jgi:subtilase family serine protease